MKFKSLKYYASALLLSFMVTGCTSVPERFNRDAMLSDNGGYNIEYEDETGFQLEVFYKSYSFYPDANDNLEEAKDYYVKAAKQLGNMRLSRQHETILLT